MEAMDEMNRQLKRMLLWKELENYYGISTRYVRPFSQSLRPRVLVFFLQGKRVDREGA
jgi:hypothetical protein